MVRGANLITGTLTDFQGAIQKIKGQQWNNMIYIYIYI